MSEERPTFKVTDRRLFNTDGTPRFSEAEQETLAAPADSTDSETGGETAATTPAAETANAPVPAAAAAAAEVAPARESTTEPTAAPASPTAGTEADPTAFANLLMFVASPAAAALGLTEHPGLGPEDIDLPLAKHCIDLLETLRQRTRGNLGPQEAQMLEGLLGELRMQYVSLTGTRPATPVGKAPRGFTGGDITGGMS